MRVRETGGRRRSDRIPRQPRSTLHPGGVDFLYEGEHLPTASGRQARAGRNRARAPRANASAESSSGFLTLGSELAIALERAGEMAPHRLARRAGIAAAD